MLAETLSVAREIEVEFESQPEDDVSIAAADMPLSEDDASEDVTVDEFPTSPELEELEAIQANVATGEAISRQTREYTGR